MIGPVTASTAQRDVRPATISLSLGQHPTPGSGCLLRTQRRTVGHPPGPRPCSQGRYGTALRQLDAFGNKVSARGSAEPAPDWSKFVQALHEITRAIVANLRV